MMKSNICWILSVGLIFKFTAGESTECVKSDLCNCYKSNEFEYQCPPGDFRYVIHTIPGKYLQIDCDKEPAYDLDLLPNIDIGNLEYLLIRFCPLPTNSLNFTLEKFNITDIQFLQLEEVLPTNVENVTKELFYGFSQLPKLSFTLFKINLEEDFLEYLPNLTILYLDNNEIREVGSRMFQYTPKLRVLHLSRNLISHIPDGLFQNLTDLIQLHLWKNELTSLNKRSFLGLKQLKSLELSSNKIRSLDDDTFAELIELVNISLRSNNLQLVTSNIFKNNHALELIWLGYNPNLKLADYVFANLTNLSRINLDNSNLENLPEHIFEGCVNLNYISLANNNITGLPELLFKDLTELKSLSLGGNKIKILPSNIFSSLITLNVLQLEENELEEINNSLFRKTTALSTLQLNYNNLSKIDLHAFINLRNLTELDLSYNAYDLKYVDNLEGLNPFSYCEKLEILNLSHNVIDRFPENIVDNKVNLISLDLSYNRIDYIRMASLIKVSQKKLKVYVNNNNVSFVDFNEIKLYSLFTKDQYDIEHNNNADTVLYLLNNALRCDCINFDLIQYYNEKIDPVVKTLVDIRIGESYCSTPQHFKHLLVMKLKPKQVSCPTRDAGCPKECLCYYRPYDDHSVVNCSYRHLTSPPFMNLTEKNSKIEINLEGNYLEAAPLSGLGYDNVTKLILSDNHIKNIEWIPEKLEILQLNGNQLNRIEPNVLNSLNNSKTLKYMTLYENPWHCGCPAITLQNFLRSHYTKVKSTDVRCEDNKPLIEHKELCKSRLSIAIAIAMPILVILFVTATVVAVYFYYQEQIKVWLYAKNLCLWFVTEEELDKDKTYDVFISYSHTDEDFVLQNLLPVLEQGPNPFKVCIHIRDWIPGEFIARQVTNSVLDSRRTLVILSNSFLESVWGKMEFRTAHIQAISDGRARVIIVKYGDLDEDKLDNELKSYLKTNTYVEWGDPWFWNKLKYALPHCKQNRFYNNNQKHANIMLKIDDKFELTSTPGLRAESTPPVISLDPSLLKDHPLTIKNTVGAIVPNGNAPLISR